MVLRERLKEQYELNREVLGRLGFSAADGVQSFRSISRLASAAIEEDESNVLVIVPSVQTIPLYNATHGSPSFFSRVSSLPGFSVRKWSGNSFTVLKTTDPLHDRGLKAPFYAAVALGGFGENGQNWASIYDDALRQDGFHDQEANPGAFLDNYRQTRSITAAQYIMLNLMRAEAGLGLLDASKSYTRLFHYPAVSPIPGISQVQCINTSSLGQFSIDEYDQSLADRYGAVRIVEDIDPSRLRK